MKKNLSLTQMQWLIDNSVSDYVKAHFHNIIEQKRNPSVFEITVALDCLNKRAWNSETKELIRKLITNK